MEKMKLKVNFEGTGFKALGNLGTIFYIIAIISLLATIFGIIDSIDASDSYYRSSTPGLIVAAYGFLTCIMTTALGTICIALKTVVRSAVLRNKTLEENYEFVTN